MPKLHFTKPASVSDSGDLTCPHCNVNIITPMEENPYKGFQLEKMLLVPNEPNQCLVCKNYYFVTEETAQQHNHYWFPDDPEFQS